MVEVEKDFASKGVAGAGLGLGIAGTALGLLQNGNLGGILGGCNNNCHSQTVCQPPLCGYARRVQRRERHCKH